MKKCAVWFMALLLSFTLFSLDVEAESLKDLQPSEQFYDEISFLVGKGVISGYPDGTFQPGKAVTRGDAAIMIGRLLDWNGAQRETKFKDVGRLTSASGYITSAVEQGIISGYSDGTFKPNAAITRGDMAIILSRAFNLDFQSVYRFKDVGENMVAFEPIRRLAGASITVGYPDSTFRPDENVTRAQFSAFLARGVEIEFKQKSAIEDSYAWDKTKQYTFRNSGTGLEVYTYKHSELFHGKDLGFIWEAYNVEKDEVDYGLYLDESYEGLTVAYPYSEYYGTLRYPVEVGKTWYTDFTRYKITAVNQTVTTPFKTFTGAVEVTTGNGTKEYYVKNIGSVKTVYPGRSYVRELVDLK